jgi:polysaccharide biosynthesis protein PslG
VADIVKTGLINFAVILPLLFTLNQNALAFEFGVGTHFGQGKGNSSVAFKWMSDAGMTSFRDEIYWKNMEFKPGKIAPNAKALLAIKAFTDANQHAFNPFLILSYGNPIYDKGSQPTSEQGRQGFAAYAKWLAGRLKGKVEYFEVWNEWNLGSGTVPKKLNNGNPVDYVKLAGISYDAIKKENPAAKVIVGAIGGDRENWPWLQDAIKAGLLKKADGVSVHLYNHSLPNNQAGAAEVVQRLRTLQTLLRKSNGGVAVPIFVTETGWPTHWGLKGVSEQIAAEQTARLLLEAQSLEDLAGIWWYELADGGKNPFEPEHRFGLLTTYLKEKPAGCRLRSLIPFIKQSSLNQNISHGNARALLFKGKTEHALLAVWAGIGYFGAVNYLEIQGTFNNAKAFDKDCGDRVTTGFKGATPTTIKIEASSYPTLIWVRSDSKLTKIVTK